jgi:hypothetical protein
MVSRGRNQRGCRHELTRICTNLTKANEGNEESRMTESLADRIIKCELQEHLRETRKV